MTCRYSKMLAILASLSLAGCDSSEVSVVLSPGKGLPPLPAGSKPVEGLAGQEQLRLRALRKEIDAKPWPDAEKAQIHRLLSEALASLLQSAVPGADALTLSEAIVHAQAEAPLSAFALLGKRGGEAFAAIEAWTQASAQATPALRDALNLVLKSIEANPNALPSGEKALRWAASAGSEAEAGLTLCAELLVPDQGALGLALVDALLSRISKGATLTDARTMAIRFRDAASTQQTEALLALVQEWGRASHATPTLRIPSQRGVWKDVPDQVVLPTTQLAHSGAGLFELMENSSCLAHGSLRLNPISGETRFTPATDWSGTCTLRILLRDRDAGGVEAETTLLTEAPLRVLSITPMAASPTNLGHISYNVVFNGEARGVLPSHFELAGTAPVGATIETVSGEGTSFTVTGSTGTGDGVLLLGLRDDNSITSAAGLPLGGPLAGDGDFVSLIPVTIDRTAPFLSLSSSTASPTKEAMAIVTGSSEPGTSLHLFRDAACTQEILAPALSSDGTFSASITLIPNALTAIFATSRDAAGNMQLCTHSGLVFVHDSLPPRLPEGVASQPPSPSSSNSLAITGVSEPQATALLFDDASCSHEIGASATDSLGAFSIPASVADNTTTDFSVRMRDAAGNLSTCSSNALRYVEDSSAPQVNLGQPSVPTVNSSGSVDFPVSFAGAGNIDLAPAHIEQMGQASCANVTILGSDMDSRIVRLAGCTGNGTLKIRLKAGAARSAAGNESLLTEWSPSLGVDNTAPGIPTEITLLPKARANENSPVINGKVDAGSSVSLFDDGACTHRIAGPLSAPAGNFSADFSVTDNSVTQIFATVTDPLGNASACSPILATFTEDSLPPSVVLSEPSQPGINSTGTVSFVATFSDAASLSLNTTGVTMEATGTAACTGLGISGSGLGTRTISLSNCTGNGTIRISLSAGSATDEAGNEAQPTAPSTAFLVDNTPPSPPVLSLGGASPANTNSPIVLAASAANTTVQAFSDAECTVATGDPLTFGSEGSLAIAGITVPENQTTTFFATATDAVGNRSPCSSPGLAFTEDSTPPSLQVGAPSRTVAGPTQSVEFPISYVGANSISLSSAHVTLETSGGVSCSKATAGEGNLSRTITVSGCSGNGSLRLQVQAGTSTDAAGNADTGSAWSLPVSIDSTAPVSPTITGTTPTSPANHNHPVVRGSAEVGSMVALFSDTACTQALGIAGLATDGSFSIAVDVADNSVTSIYAKATDVAGNASSCSLTPFSYTEDSNIPGLEISAPSPLVARQATSASFAITYSNASSITLDPTHVMLQTTGTAACQKEVSATGADTRLVTLTNCTGDGQVKIVIAAGTATNVANNAAPETGPSAALVVDNTAPTAPVIASSNPASPSSNNAPAIAGNAEAGVSVRLYSDTGCTVPVGAPVTATNGAFSIPISVSENSVTSLRGKATDAAGNVSACSAAEFAYTEDSTPPSASVSAPSAEWANGTSIINYTVTYTGATTISLSKTTFVRNTTGSATCNKAVTGTGTTTRTVTLSGCTGNGTVGISLEAGTAADDAGNLADATAPSATFTVDTNPPTIAIGAPSLSQVSGNGSVGFSLTYSGADTISLSPTQVSLNATNGVSCSVAVSGSGNAARTVTLSSCSGNGSVGISIQADSGHDLAGNGALAAGPSGTFTVDTDPPLVSIGAPSVAVIKASSSVDFVVNYTNATSISLTAADVALNAVGVSGCSKSISGNGTSTRTVSLTGCTGNGTVGISLAAATATDAVGNAALGAGPSPTVTVDNTAPGNAAAASSAPTSPANNNSPTISGTAEAGATVRLYSDAGCSNSLGNGTATGGSFAIPIAVTDNSTTPIFATVTDVAGNASSCASTGISYVEDSTPPAIAIGSPSATTTNDKGTVTYTITYTGAAAITLSAADVTLNAPAGVVCTKSVNGSGTSERTVTLSGCTGNGNLGISLTAATARDAAMNAATAAGPSATFAVDNTPPAPPVITDSTPASPSNSNTPTADGTSEAGALVTLYTDAACTIPIGNPATASGGGTFAIAVSVASDTTTSLYAKAKDGAGNSSTCSTTRLVYTEDSTPPAITLSAPDDSSVGSTQAAAFTVTYTGASSVSLTAADVVVNASAGVACSKAVGGSGTATRTVTLSGCTGNGTAGISLAAGTATDAASNSALAAGPSATTNVDNTAPSVAVGAPNRTLAKASDTVTYTVTYGSATAVTLAAGNVTLNKTGTADCLVAVGGTGTATRTVTLSACSGDGTVGITISSGTASDDAGNLSTASAASATFTVDNTAPAIAIAAPSAANVKSTATVNYTVTYTGATASSLAVANVTLNKTGTANCTVGVSGTGADTRTVSLTSCQGDGTVGISIAAGTATDGAGNGAPTAGPSATFIVDNTAPTQAIGAPNKTVVKSSTANSYTVTYTGANTVTLVAANVTLNKTGTANCTVGVTGTGTATRTINLTNCLGDGTVGVSLVAGTASDTAGNTSLAAGPSATFTVDNTPPQVAITSPNGGADLLTPATSVTLSGTCNADASTLSLSPALTLADANCADGTWSSNADPFGWESTLYTVTATDAAGNTATADMRISKQVVVGQPNQTTSETSRLMGSGLNFVWTNGTKLAISDTSCHRVLLWNAMPATGNQPPDVVLGVPSADLCPPAGNYGGISASSLNSPRQVFFDGTRLYVAEYSNHRVLIWNSWPTTNNQAANVVVGQANFTSGAPNRGGTAPTAATLANPQGVKAYGTKLVIADTGNSRVLIFNTIPTANDASANNVLGQSDFVSKGGNNGGVSASSLASPMTTEMVGTKFLVSDSGNGRVLIFNAFPTTDKAAANNVVGRATFTDADNLTDQSTLYGTNFVHSDGTRLFVSDYSAHRVLVWSTVPTTDGAAATYVLGQPTWTYRAPNNAGSEDKNLTAPLGLASAGGTLFVSDGNGRVLKYAIATLANNAAPTGVIGREALTDVGSYMGLKVSTGSNFGMARVGSKFALADSQNHRILLWNTAPDSILDPPDYVLGQADMTATLPNGGGAVSASSLNYPYNVTLVGDGTATTKVIVADSGNHRVLIWSAWPTASNQAANIVLGQPNKTTNTYATTQTGLYSPRQVWSNGTKLLVADISNHRIMVWDTFPTADGTAANWELGQTGFTTRVNVCSATGLYNPTGVWSNGTRIFVSDYSNHRIMIWNAWPTGSGGAASIVLGQADFTTCTANRGGAVADNTLWGPYYISGESAGRFFATDYLNSRVLVWNTLPTATGQGANLVLGQPDMVTNTAVANDGDFQQLSYPRTVFYWSDGISQRLYVGNDGAPQTVVWNKMPTQNGTPFDSQLATAYKQDDAGVKSTWLSAAYSAVVAGGKLVVADSGNNRILIWNSIPTADGVAPNVVLGQANFTSNLPNAGNAAPTAARLFSPTSVATDGTKLVVADQRNHRVLIWNTVPTVTNTAASVVLGQADFLNNGACPSGVTASCMVFPSSVAVAGGKLLVSDRGNHRILIFNTIPIANNTAANLVLGQTTLTGSLPGTTASTLRNPNWVATDGTAVAVADQLNHRVLVWRTFPTVSGTAADLVLGQADAVTANANAFGKNNLASLQTPNIVSVFDGRVWAYDSYSLGFKYWDYAGAINGEAAIAMLGRTPGIPIPLPSATAMVPYGQIDFSGGYYLLPDYYYRRILIRASSP